MPKRTFALGGAVKLRKPSIFVINSVSHCLSFNVRASTAEGLHCYYVYIHCSTCTGTIIPLEPCELNAEFQHFIPDLIKFPYFMDTTETGVRG
jgi:hypothetical protein